MIKQFGGSISEALEKQYAKSANWKDGKFENLIETSMDFSFQNIPKLLYKQFIERKGRMPKADLGYKPFEKDAFLAPSDKAKMIWYGHSVVLLRINGKTLLIDPMLGPDAAPIAPFSTARFSANTLDIIDELPEIDLMLLTHDHYDHLDYASIKKLKAKTKKYFVALGLSRHLQQWGIDQSSITEFDWWESETFAHTQITFTPSRHFSGRGLTDRSKSLWGGWVFKTDVEAIYFSGDSGYGPHFEMVGKRLGPFDFGLMECGQYNENWHQIHMFPEESVQAAVDADVRKAMPVHWGAFALALHHWQDPVQRFESSAKEAGLAIHVPLIGTLFTLEESHTHKWWEDVS